KSSCCRSLDTSFSKRQNEPDSDVRGSSFATANLEPRPGTTNVERRTSNGPVMRPFSSTISLDEARRRLDANLRPIARTERVALDAAAGRVAAANVVSPCDVPPFARSAMDGYAVIAADTTPAAANAPPRLRIVDRIYTGRPSSIAIEHGTC